MRPKKVMGIDLPCSRSTWPIMASESSNPRDGVGSALWTFNPVGGRLCIVWSSYYACNSRGTEWPDAEGERDQTENRLQDTASQDTDPDTLWPHSHATTVSNLFDDVQSAVGHSRYRRGNLLESTTDSLLPGQPKTGSRYFGSFHCGKFSCRIGREVCSGSGYFGFVASCPNERGCRRPPWLITYSPNATNNNA